MRWSPMLLLIVAAGYFARPYLSPAPVAVRPLDPGALDPAVSQLIATKIKSVDTNPRDADFHADLAIAYEANSLWREARESYENAVSLEAGRPEWRLHHAIATRQSGDFDDALALLEQLAIDDPASPALHQRLAETLLEAGRLDDAEAAFRRLIELNPSAVQGPVGLADVLLQQQQSDEAISLLEAAIARQPDYRKAHYLLGRAYTLAGRQEDAAPALARGAEATTVFLTDPLSSKIASYAVNVTGRLDRARAYLEAGQPDRAAQVLEQSYQHHGSNTMLLNTLATAYLRINRMDDAHRLLQRARELEDDQFFTFLNLSQWALRTNDMEQALKFADQAIERAPERDETHLARAQALTELGRNEEALVSADKARELGSRKAPNFGLSGEICLRLERFADARSHFAHATEMQPNYLPAWVGLARAHLSLENRAEAGNALTEAQRIAPNHPAVQRLAIELAGGR